MKIEREIRDARVFLLFHVLLLYFFQEKSTLSSSTFQLITLKVVSFPFAELGHCLKITLFSPT